MKLRATASLAIGALLRNKLRSLLTALGIVIGVAAVVTMQAMGQGATAYVGSAISGLGSNMLMAMPGATKGMTTDMATAPPFNVRDVEAIRRLAHDVRLVAGINQRILRVVAGANNRSLQVVGTSPDYFEIRGWSVSSGRPLNEDDERRAALTCVVGQTVVDTLYEGRSPLGKELRVHDLSCRVVGVLEAKGSAGFGDQDDLAILPESTFSRRILGTDRVGALIAQAVTQGRLDSAKAQLIALLRTRRHLHKERGDDDNFTIRDPRELQTILQSVTGMLTLLLAGIAAISLLVGGIGIMNIMLVSVTERTREIGIRLAIGARGGDILQQFLVEAVVLSALGGLAGIALGLLGALAAARAINVPFVAPLVAMPVAFGVSLLVGVVFGVVPARKAARLNPLAALRFE